MDAAGYFGFWLLILCAFFALAGLFDTNWKYMLWSLLCMITGMGLIAWAG